MYSAIVIGASTGGVVALKKLLNGLNNSIEVPIIICQHYYSQANTSIASFFNRMLDKNVIEPIDKEKINDGNIYFAPSDYHLIIEDGYFNVTLDEKVLYSRPSIDVMFESAAYYYQDSLIGVLLTGANHDGGKGLLKIKEFGGYTIVQDIDEADAKEMPQYAKKISAYNDILTLDMMIEKINSILEA